MRSGKNIIFLIIFAVLVAATAVSAAPIVTYCDPVEFTNSASVDAGIFHSNVIIFIVLIGFFCVSLVIDRKLWLATLTAPQRTGQSGFYYVPQLSGISAGTITFPSYISMQDKIRQKYNIHRAIHITNAFIKFTIKHFSSLHKPALICCMALSYKLNKSFSPAFIFVRLARGPPVLT
ncbi:MAG: hypothetical protein RQ760_16495 [Sedimentisphaerales bacterium]|nr:hypothetical protein [Sedimentisphaerales bacterium]